MEHSYNPKKNYADRRARVAGLHPGTDGPNRAERRLQASDRYINKGVEYQKKIKRDRLLSEARRQKEQRFRTKVEARRALKGKK